MRTVAHRGHNHAARTASTFPSSARSSLAAPPSIQAREAPNFEQLDRRARFGHTLEHLTPPPASLQPSGVGKPLPEELRERMEPVLGADLSDVRVHEDSKAPSIGAEAYTQGRHIHFTPGKFQPNSLPGRTLIGHEVGHVIQQRAGRVTVPQGKGAPINEDPALEAEADALGAKAARSAAPRHPRSAGISGATRLERAPLPPPSSGPLLTPGGGASAHGGAIQPSREKNRFHRIMNREITGRNLAPRANFDVPHALQAAQDRYDQGRPDDPLANVRDGILNHPINDPQRARISSDFNPGNAFLREQQRQRRPKKRIITF
jgi:hypothetical protein